VFDYICLSSFIIFWCCILCANKVEYIIELLKAKCLPALYYGLEACPVNKSQIKSLEYVLNNTFRKIFATQSFDVAMLQLNVYYILGVQFRRHSGQEKVNF